jgi:retron-type reverse transcriptase
MDSQDYRNGDGSAIEMDFNLGHYPKLILEPILEADFEPNAYGYRPKKSAQDAIREVDQLLYAGYTEVVDADLWK